MTLTASNSILLGFEMKTLFRQKRRVRASLFRVVETDTFSEERRL